MEYITVQIRDSVLETQYVSQVPLELADEQKWPGRDRGVINHDMGRCLLSINGEVDIHPLAFYQLNEENRKNLIKLTRTRTESNDLDKICKDERIVTKKHVSDAYVKILRECGAHECLINFLESARPYELQEFTKKHKDLGKRHFQNVVKITEKFITLRRHDLQIDNLLKYCYIMEFVWYYLNDPNKRYRNQKLNKLLDDDDDEFNKIWTRFSNIRACVLQVTSGPQFICPLAATYHVYKHRDMTTGTTDEEITAGYFEVVKEVCESKNKVEVSVSQEGDVRQIYKLEKASASILVVLQRNIGEDTEYIITAYCKDPP